MQGEAGNSSRYADYGGETAEQFAIIAAAAPSMANLMEKLNILSINIFNPPKVVKMYKLGHGLREPSPLP